MEDEITCNKCNGEGKVFSEHSITICPKCLGFKRVTWTENITGVKRLDGYVYMPYLPLTIIPNNITLQEATTKEEVNNIAKLYGFNTNFESKEELLECLKKILKKV